MLPAEPAAVRFFAGLRRRATAVDHRLPAALAESARRRGDQRVAQQALGGHHHQRQRIHAQQRGLAAQQVEIIGRGGAVGYAQVVLRRQA